MKLVLGANGRLGTALTARLGSVAVRPERNIYESWWRADSVPAVTRYLKEQDQPIDTIFVAAGIIDPSESATQHERVNQLIPQQVIRAAVPMGIRVVTFGTMMEILSSASPASTYVASKVELARFVSQQARLSDSALHLRIHTLYGGGPPDPFMFTGQMLTALRKREPFLMSPGTQLREYHHVIDEVDAIISLAESTARGVVDLNHGDAISLAELAQTTFRAFDAGELLRIGSLSAPTNERLGLRFERTPELAGQSFRDVRRAMVEYLAGFLPHPGANP